MVSLAEPPLEIIDEGPYTGTFLNNWDVICMTGMRIYSYPLDSFLSCFISTSKELKSPLRRYLYVIFALPFWALCTMVTFPIGALFVLLWIPVSGLRKPYRFSYVRNALPLDRTAKTSYTCVTSNVCVMHEVLTRFNNQQNTNKRAKEIGQRFATQQLGLQEEYLSLTQDNLMNTEVHRFRDEKLRSMRVVTLDEVNSSGKSSSDSLIQNEKTLRRRQSEIASQQLSEVQFDHSVLTEFPNMDFLCLQETWELWCSRKLIKELHRVFPYVLYDACVDSPASNMYMLNSGALIASRYPIVESDFNFYTCSYKQGKLASKGLLQAKVSLGVAPDGRHVTGYLSNTHLQAYQGTYPVHKHQMNDIVKWTKAFRSRTHLPNEVIAFDLVCGDFNADNMSPVDEASWHHDLFKVYTDPCRVKPGLDHDWTVGTEMRQTPLDDSLIQTPLGLQLAIQNPYLLQQYVISADIVTAVIEMAFEMPPRDEQGNLILSPVGGRRRIDLVLHRNEDNVKVTSCNAVTQLAGLTDHIPYSLTFNVTF